MIINHSKKFIFFANRKTASTSAAIALSSSCNRKDVITPLGRDEKIRRELGYQKPINYIPWRNKISYFAIEAKGRLLKKGVNRELKSIGLRFHNFLSWRKTRKGIKILIWIHSSRAAFWKNLQFPADQSIATKVTSLWSTFFAMSSCRKPSKTSSRSCNSPATLNSLEQNQPYGLTKDPTGKYSTQHNRKASKAFLLKRSS